GLSEYVSREIAARGDEEHLAYRLVTFRLATLPVAYGLAFLTARATGAASLVMIAGGVAFALALAVTDSLAAIHRGFSRHDREALECAVPAVAIGVAWALGKLGVTLAVAIGAASGVLVL